MLDLSQIPVLETLPLRRPEPGDSEVKLTTRG